MAVKPIWKGRWAAAHWTGKEGAAEFDSKETLKQKQRGRAVQNKAEEKQHNQNTMITVVWSVTQVKIKNVEADLCKDNRKNNKSTVTTEHDGNVLVISTVSRFTATTTAV